MRKQERLNNKTIKLSRILFATTVFLVLTIPNSFSQTFEHKVDSVLEVMFQPDAPGGVFLAAKDGKIMYRKAFGLSNMELEVPMKPENVFQIGSMTKQFTAVAILILMEEGKLNLEDDITKFIPDYPSHGNKVTIHHLLTHTSGIKDFTQMNALREVARNDLEPIEIIELFKDEPFDFSPGEEFRYSNSGYILLGFIIENLSGVPYKKFIEDRIFRVAGMKDSRYASDREIIRNRAYGYHNRDGLYNKTFISMKIPYAAGALMSTVDDMLNWQLALNQDLLVNKKTLKKAFQTYKLNDGTKLNYGYGWHLKEIENSPTREHGGSIFGFKSMGVYIPGKDIYVIGLSNCDCNSPTKITRDIASWALKYL